MKHLIVMAITFAYVVSASNYSRSLEVYTCSNGELYGVLVDTVDGYGTKVRSPALFCPYSTVKDYQDYNRVSPAGNKALEDLCRLAQTGAGYEGCHKEFLARNLVNVGRPDGQYETLLKPLASGASGAGPHDGSGVVRD